MSKDPFAVLKGNLAPDGAIIKTAAASAHLMTHTGPAVVFCGTTTTCSSPPLHIRPSRLVLGNTS